MTQEYIGTKRVVAWPQTHDEAKGGAITTPGYAVKYPDGYVSWSPKETFEAAYQPVTAMSFSGALVALKSGHLVARAGWNGKGMWIALQTPDMLSKMQRPYIYMAPIDGSLVPWVASQTDMLADDWTIVAGPEAVAAAA